MDKNRIMIIDDTPANLDVLSQILSDEKYTVLPFPRGKLALKPAQMNPPDLILLDIMMPDMDGFETCKLLKENERTRDIPVIFLSAVTETSDKVKAFSSGGVDFISKPFQVPEVLARVKTHLELSRMKRELTRHNHELEDLVHEKVKDLLDSQMATLQAIISLAEYRDEDTGMHIERTREYCRLLAVELRQHSLFLTEINEAYIRDIYHAAPLHDIGKVAIPDQILLKPGPLTDHEFEVIKTHVTIGAATLQKVLKQYPKNSYIQLGIELTSGHHEKWDGSGYPQGLAGEDIPLSGRIMAVADVYDALRSRRPYKEPKSHLEAVSYIKKAAGTHFDPVIIEIFSRYENEFQSISENWLNDAESAGS